MDLADAAYDAMVLRLGGPAGYGGIWRWLTGPNQAAAEAHLLLDEQGRLTLQVRSACCPIKFAAFTSVEQLGILLDYILDVCPRAAR